MRLSRYFLPTLKEDPQEAETTSHRLMLRARLIKRLGSGSYTWLPIGYRVLRKVTDIIRRVMDENGALELQMPIVQSAELWKESGRWSKYGPELLRLLDRHRRDYCLAPTHEEVITDIARTELGSYRDLPVNFYQIQTKFRDEIRPRFGVIRAREFLMKDAYSFHSSIECLENTYHKMHRAYSDIFTLCGLRFRAVAADSGAIGGSRSHEFHVLAEVGEDLIAFAEDRDYEPRNAELVALEPPNQDRPEAGEELRKRPTPNIKTIAQLSRGFQIPERQTLKTIVARADPDHCSGEYLAILLRGDHQLNAVKAEAHPWVKSPLTFCDEATIRQLFSAGVGSLGPLNCPIPCLADHAAAVIADFVTGANEDDYHYFGVNWERDLPLPESTDLRLAVEGDPVPGHPEIKLKLERGIEVGHIFQLGQTYSKPMGAQYRDREGRMRDFIMGCYGIGVSRIVAAAIEQNHDDKGIIWTDRLAPFSVIIVALNYEKSQSVRQHADGLYQELSRRGSEVVLDDRPLHPGAKFKDADLIGIPHRVVVGEKSLSRSVVEYKDRREGRKLEFSIDNLNALFDVIDPPAVNSV